MPATESFVRADVTANAITPTTDNTPTYSEGTYNGVGIPLSASTTLAPTEAKSLSAGGILNIPAVSLTTVWAPVNCGYDATNYKWGKLYQFGRAVGGGYNDGSTFTEDVYQIAETSASVSSTANTNPADNVFYKGTAGVICDWYITNGTRLSSLPMDSSHSQYVAGKIANPCPEGWRVPTESELTALMGRHTGGPYWTGAAYIVE